MIKHQLSLKPSHMDGKHQSPPQISKLRRIKGFCENIGQLSLDVYVSHLNVSLLYMISQEVVSPLNMSHFLWKIGFLVTEMALVLSHMRETLSNLTPKSLMVCIIQSICEQQLHTQPRWWTVQLKIIFEKTSKREKIQENEKSQNCSFGQSHNPQNQHQKRQQDQTKKKQNTKFQTQGCVWDT
jgi:hypothetical protein